MLGSHLLSSRRPKRHRIAFRKWKLRRCPLSAGLAVFLRPCGCGAGNATGSRGERPDRLKYVATDGGKPLFHGLESAAARQFGSRFDPRFSLGDERAICTFLVEQGSTHVTPQVVDKIHFVSEVESFLLFNLWVAVADLYRENARASGRIFSLGCARTRPSRLTNSRVAPVFGIQRAPTWSPPDSLSVRSNFGKASDSAT
jgi:hypothetical protein